MSYKFKDKDIENILSKIDLSEKSSLDISFTSDVMTRIRKDQIKQSSWLSDIFVSDKFFLKFVFGSSAMALFLFTVFTFDYFYASPIIFEEYMSEVALLSSF